MALTVGELLATVAVDESQMRPGLARAEGAMRSTGSSIAADADRAGRQAGQALGDGLTIGADGRIRDARGRFAAAGGEAGGGVSEGMLGGLSGGLKAGLAGVAATAGALLMSAFTDAMEQGQIVGKLRAQLGATPAEAKKYGEIAGELYANAVTEDFQGAADTISAVMRAGIAPPDATNAQLESIATKVADLSNTFELDLGQTANAVGQMIKTGLAKNGVEAVDALTAGLQKMGPRADDIADTFNEYSTIFRQMGISATEATGLLSQGMKAGARDTDVVADSLKEFVLIAQGGGEDVNAAFAKIGLSGEEMREAFVKGGPAAREALDKVFDGLRNMGNETDRNAVALTLFGTKSEDTQKALMALDPSSAAEALGNVGGAAERMGDSLRDNAGARITQFQRSLQQNVVEFLGGQVIPAFENVRSYITTQFSSIWTEAGEGGAEGVDRLVNAFQILGDRVVEKIKELAPKAIEAVIGFGQTVADYITSNPEQVFKIGLIATALIVAIASLPLLVGAALISAATAMIWSFVGGLISSLGENIPKWWDSFTGWIEQKAGQAGSVFSVLGSAISNWFSGLWSRYVSGPVSRAWSSLIGTVQGLPSRSVNALGSLGNRLGSAASQHWNRFKIGTTQKAAEAIEYVRGIPGRARSALGNLGSYLYASGQSLIRGFINGIRNMIGSVRDAASSVVSTARDFFPFSPAKRGPFSGRGYTTYSGAALVAGFAKGILTNMGQVDRALSTMSSVQVPGAVGGPSLAAAGAYGSAGYGAVGTAGASGSLVHIENWHASDHGSPEDNARALAWLGKGRG